MCLARPTSTQEEDVIDASPLWWLVLVLPRFVAGLCELRHEQSLSSGQLLICRELQDEVLDERAGFVVKTFSSE